MRKLALLSTALIFTGVNLALAVPAAPVGVIGQALTSDSDSKILLVRNDKKSKKVNKSKNKKAKKSLKGSGGGMNMPNMPPGHKM